MTPKEQAAMQQALEALEHYGIEGTKSVGGIKCTAAITALREALAQPQGEWVDLTDDDISDTYAIWWRQKHVFGSFTHAAIAKFKEKNTPPVVPQGEPVAWMFCLDGCNQVVLDEDSDSVIRHNGTPLVPAPQPVKELTDDEIMDLVRDECVDMRWPSTPLFIARAVIAAYKEKNK